MTKLHTLSFLCAACALASDQNVSMRDLLEWGLQHANGTLDEGAVPSDVSFDEVFPDVRMDVSLDASLRDTSYMMYNADKVESMLFNLEDHIVLDRLSDVDLIPVEPMMKVITGEVLAPLSVRVAATKTFNTALSNMAFHPYITPRVAADVERLSSGLIDICEESSTFEFLPRGSPLPEKSIMEGILGQMTDAAEKKEYTPYIMRWVRELCLNQVVTLALLRPLTVLNPDQLFNLTRPHLERAVDAAQYPLTSDCVSETCTDSENADFKELVDERFITQRGFVTRLTYLLFNYVKPAVSETQQADPHFVAMRNMALKVATPELLSKLMDFSRISPMNVGLSEQIARLMVVTTLTKNKDEVSPKDIEDMAVALNCSLETCAETEKSFNDEEGELCGTLKDLRDRFPSDHLRCGTIERF